MHCLNNIPVVCLCLQVGELSCWRSLALAADDGCSLGMADKGRDFQLLTGLCCDSESSGSTQFSDLLWNVYLYSYIFLSYPSKKKKILSFLTDRAEGERLVIFFPYCFPRSFSFPSSWTPPAPLKYHIIHSTSFSPNCLQTSRPFLILWRFRISLFLSLPFLSSPLSFTTYVHTHDGDFIIYTDDHSSTWESYSSHLLLQ